MKTNIKEFALKNMSKYDFDTPKHIFDYVQQGNSELNILDLSDMSISTNDALSLASIIKTNPSIEKMNIKCTKMSDQAASILFVALHSNLNVVDVNLSGTRLSTNALNSLADCLAKNSSIKSMNLSLCNLADHDVGLLVDGIAKNQNTALESLNLAVNIIGDDGLKKIFNFLNKGHKHKLQNINLKRNDLVREPILLHRIESLLSNHSGSDDKPDSKIDGKKKHRFKL
jgi:Ran GTPase-activating protein (RanGAP) involved in mRNA processing and transport